MVKAIVNIEESANRILNIVKAKENLRDKSAAINLILNLYGKEMLEPELRPEFIKELLEAQKEETAKVKDWDKHFGLN
ncbi:antitoxin [Candidatus Woesearchaeota archaeon B3_Woes]|nr:MAG: antitoxin [Candidatus Woesearchaeota archaeon B3_Woes]